MTGRLCFPDGKLYPGPMHDEKGLDSAVPRRNDDLFAESAPPEIQGRILCVGGAALDSTFLAERSIVAGTSNPATGTRAFGGVARNIAENLARLGVTTGLLSCVGDDDNGRRLTSHLADLGVDTQALHTVSGYRTAEYIALMEPDRNLSVGIADMVIFDRLDLALLDRAADSLAADWIFADCNCTPALLNALIGRSASQPGRLAIDTVSVAKAERLPASLVGVDLLFVNLDEAASVLRVPRRGLAPQTAMAGLRQRGAADVIVTMGADGLLVSQPLGAVAAIPAMAAEVADVTGAGDAMVATTLAAVLAGLPLPVAARWGCFAATMTLERIGSTRPDLSFSLLRERAGRMSR